MFYEPAWALEAAVQQMGYQCFDDIPQSQWEECFDLADMHAKSVSMTVAQATVLRDWFDDAVKEVSR
jgi:hypothetical protein